VDSIQSGTGAYFSAFPPENATGNFVKIIQRVPVKLVFDQQLDPALTLGPGMSVIATVHTLGDARRDENAQGQVPQTGATPVEMKPDEAKPADLKLEDKPETKPEDAPKD